MTYVKAFAEKVELSNEDVITTSGGTTDEWKCSTRNGKKCTGWTNINIGGGECKIISGNYSLHDAF